MFIQIGGCTIKPLTLTRFWHRRICEAIILVSALILALYFWAFFADVKSLNAGLLVGETAAIPAGATLIIGVVSYFWAPKKYIFWGAYTAYAILCVTSAILILNTGGTSSPFVALWMVVAVFAGVFGFYSILPLFIAITAYLTLQFIGGHLGKESIIAFVLAGELPLIVSYIIWHTKSTPDTSDQAYHELATELSQVANKSDTVIKAIADGVIALDGKGAIQLINPAAQQIIGWGKQDALALDYKSVLKLVDSTDKELTPANDPVSQVLAINQEVATDRLTLLTNSGKKLLVSIIVSPVGQLGAGVIVVFRDITKEKAAEREQAEFISTASHEMRTPVASIEGYLGLALNPATSQIDDKARSYIVKAHESVEHLGRLFQDLLDVSKADDGRMPNKPKVVDLVVFTHDIVQGLRPKAEEKGLRVMFKPQPDDDEERGGERRVNPVFYANVDNDHLREILNNLVENAIKYTPTGDIVVDVTGDSEHVTISVTDSGIGIPQEDQVHLFQKFYRVDNSQTREIGGTGLGLYLSRRLAESMNGRIWLESEYKQGSTFNLEIPRIDHEEAMRLIESAATTETDTISDVTIETPSMPEQEQPVPTIGQAVASNPQPTIQQPRPVAPIEPLVQPVPIQPQPPQYQYPPQPSAIPTPLPAIKPNTPLTSIEQNPSQYLRSRPGGVAVPPREPN